MEEKMFNVAKVVNTHGIKGEVKTIRITDFEERFKSGQKLFWIKEGNDPLPLTVSGHRKHKNFDMLFFEEINSLSEAERLKEGILKVSEQEQQELDEGEYYYHQIIGSTVVTLEGQKLGLVKEILSPGANDVWVVERTGKKDLLIPYIEEVVKDVELENKLIRISPMEGLLEE